MKVRARVKGKEPPKYLCVGGYPVVFGNVTIAAEWCKQNGEDLAKIEFEDARTPLDWHFEQHKGFATEVEWAPIGFKLVPVSA